MDKHKNFNKILRRRAIVYFPDDNHYFYISKSLFHRSFKHYHTYVNNETHTNALHFRLPLLRVCIKYYNKFVNQDSPITEDSTMKYILLALLKYVDVIALVLSRSEVTSLLFKKNRSSGYVDDKLDQQLKMKFTPQTVMLSFDIEKEQQDLEKQRNELNVLISKELLVIKEKYKEVNK
jgi:hypothetical protein